MCSDSIHRRELTGCDSYSEDFAQNVSEACAAGIGIIRAISHVPGEAVRKSVGQLNSSPPGETFDSVVTIATNRNGAARVQLGRLGALAQVHRDCASNSLQVGTTSPTRSKQSIALPSRGADP